jgi:hypothetical protein
MGPMEELFALGNPNVIDGGIPMIHESFLIELPVLVAVSSIPLAIIVVEIASGQDLLKDGGL